MKNTFLKAALPLIVLAAGLTLVPGCGKEPAKEASTGAKEAGEPAKPLSVTSYGGREMSLEALKGKVVVVNFWASWCGPCKVEAPEVEKAYKALEKVGVEFIGVAVEDSEENSRKFIAEHGLTFPIGRDASGDIMKAYNIYGVPTTYVIGRDGRVKYIHSGAVTEEDLVREVRKAL